MMSEDPLLVIEIAEPARARPLSVARSQAYAAAAAATNWRVLTERCEPTDPVDTDRRAVVLIGAHSSEITRWLKAKWGVIADGVWSSDPAEIREVVALAQQLGQPLLQGDELLYAPVLSGALTEASEIGAITSVEVRSMHPREVLTTSDLRMVHGPSAMMRLLLSLKVLRLGQETDVATALSMVWDQIERPEAAGPDTRHVGRMLLPGASTIPPTRLQIVISSHRGQSVIQDLQFSSATAVVRADLMPMPHLEVNGETVVLPEATSSPAQLEWFGMTPMLQLMWRAVMERTQPLTSPSLLADALRLISL
jgi:hypothetical protein